MKTLDQVQDSRLNSFKNDEITHLNEVKGGGEVTEGGPWGSTSDYSYCDEYGQLCTDYFYETC